MTALVSALYAEGRSDERFLPVLLQRSMTDWLGSHSSRIVDVLEPLIVNPARRGDRAERILAAAKQISGYHLLFVHADADDNTSQRAYTERIAPGVARISAARTAGEAVCAGVIPIIPVQMVEAWLLADADTLCNVIGAAPSPRQLEIPLRPDEIERITDPKQRLREIMQRAYASRPRRRRAVELGELYEPLANQIRLAELERLPSYQQYLSDLDSVLRRLHFVPENR